MIPHRSQFWQYMAQNLDSVRVDNSQHCAVVGIDTIELNLMVGFIVVLHDVWHVPKLTSPPILVGQLDDDGSMSSSYQEGGHSIEETTYLLQGTKVHSLYPLYVALKDDDLFLVDIPVSSLWHGWLRHLSKAGITHLSKSGYIPKLSFSDHQFCEHC